MNSEDYYGKPKKEQKSTNRGEEKRRENYEERYEESCCKQMVVIFTSLLGLISLLALIALNIANLAEIYRTKTDSNELLNVGTSIKDIVTNIREEIVSDIKPQTNLINQATSYKIPTLISAHTKLLQNDIMKFCSPRADTEGRDCPVNYSPFHSGLFQIYDPGLETNCILQDQFPSVTQNLSFQSFASFIPSATNPRGCTRIPTFSLSKNIYSYSHSMIDVGCSDWTKSSQFWTIGRIVAGQNQKPVFLNLVNWYFADSFNRKSCSTAAGNYGAWLGCSIINSTEREDYASTGIEPITIAYQDVYGRRREWHYQESDITFDYKYDALYFSVGSGVVIGNNVYLLAYGALRRPLGNNAYCYSPECLIFNQSTCNQAQRPYVFDQKQVVNAIVKFNTDYNVKPTITVRTIPPVQYDIGAEGRLIHFEESGKTYIYKRSTSWHSLLFFGEINIKGDLSITWFNFKTFSRPGTGQCTAANRCPKVCVTGVYTDYYPLNTHGDLGVSVILRSQTERLNPTVRIATMNRGLLMYQITNSAQKAAYTTTTCFKFNYKVWCVSIVEMEPGTVGLIQPVSIMYEVHFECRPAAFFHPEIEEGSGDYVEGMIASREWIPDNVGLKKWRIDGSTP